MVSYVYCVVDIRTKASNSPVVEKLMPQDFAESIKRGVLTGGIKPEAARAAQLFYLGTYDDVALKFELEKEPELILNLFEYVEAAESTKA